MTEHLHHLLIDLCRIPSPSGHEGAVAAYIRAEVERLGFAVEMDDAGPALGSDTGNLIIHTPGTGEPFFLAAHMDTVPPTLDDTGRVPVRVDGDRVHTSGRSILGADDKAGVAVALALLAEAAAAPGAYRPLDVIFTVQEEQGARGARHVDPARIRARSGFNLDGDTPVAVAIRKAPHKLRFYIDVEGRAAHAALNPEDGINAVAAVGAIAAALPTGRLDETTIANLGRIEGGGPINVVPDRARLIGEARSLVRADLDGLKARITALVQAEAAARGAQATITWDELYAGYDVPEDAPIAQLYRAACKQAGHAVGFVTTYGGGDANAFNNKGLACVVFGLGMQAIHSRDEYIQLSDLNAAFAILQTATRAEPA